MTDKELLELADRLQDFALAEGCPTAAMRDAAAILRKMAEEVTAEQKLRKLTGLANALLQQIDINDFVDSHGHSAKMLKPVHDLMRALTTKE